MPMLKNLRPLREMAGLSQAQLAQISGVSQSHISKLEIAKDSPTLKTLLKLAQALNVPVQALLDEPREEVPTNA